MTKTVILYVGSIGGLKFKQIPDVDDFNYEKAASILTDEIKHTKNIIDIERFSSCLGIGKSACLFNKANKLAFDWVNKYREVAEIMGYSVHTNIGSDAKYLMVPPLASCQGFINPCTNKGEWRKQNTAYHDDDKNWVFMCDKCALENDEYWAEEWRSISMG